MAPQYVYTMHGLVKVINGEKILDGIYLSFYPGAKIGIVGDNGSGKSTLLRIMAGIDQDFIGHSEPAKGIKVGYVPQDPKLDTTKTVYENVEMAFSDVKALIDEYNRLAESEEMSDPDKMEKILEKMGDLQEKIEQVGGWELEQKIKVAAEALVLPDLDSDVTKLSGGERRRVALCKALLEQPDILLLDEPTNHLDAETVQWLEKQLQEYPGTVIIVTHDRYFLDNITKWILELDNGKGIPYEGNYSSWLEQKIAKLEKEKKESFKLYTLKKELEWMKLNQKEKKLLTQSHINDYYKRVENQEKDYKEIGIPISPGPRLGDFVLEIKNLCKSYNDLDLIIDMNLSLKPGSIVGVIGPNGVGKSTLFNIISGIEKPDKGSIELGPTVVLSYVDQHREKIDENKTVFQAVCDNFDTIKVGNREINSREYLSRFGFKGKDQQKYVKDLSGGERNRAYLSKLLRKGGNFILLDEPSNDLDITTLRMLENGILEFNGCVMVISHDRFFLDRICTHIIAFEGQGKVRFFEGNYSEYESTRRKELGSDYDKSRKSRYKKLKLEK
jgi:ATP-binding cassette ChvD family protein